MVRGVETRDIIAATLTILPDGGMYLHCGGASYAVSPGSDFSEAIMSSLAMSHRLLRPFQTLSLCVPDSVVKELREEMVH